MAVAEAQPAAVARETPGEDDLVAPTLRVRRSVLSGGRVEVASPYLREGEVVEIDIRLPDAAGEYGDAIAASAPAQPEANADRASADEAATPLVEWLRSLPPGPRSADTWADVERQLREERDSWDR